MNKEEFEPVKGCPLCSTIPVVGGGMIVHPVCDCFGDDCYVDWNKWDSRPFEDELREELEKSRNYVATELQNMDTEESYLKKINDLEAENNTLKLNLSETLETMSVVKKSLNEKISLLQDHAKRLEAERRWIPVSERLPDDGVMVMVSKKSAGCAGHIVHTDYIAAGMWQFSVFDNITHWQPLPKPPEVE